VPESLIPSWAAPWATVARLPALERAYGEAYSGPHGGTGSRSPRFERF
jgi:hypothetical protein